MFDIYKQQNAGVEIINATVAGGAGTNAKAVLQTRLPVGSRRIAGRCMPAAKPFHMSTPASSSR